MCGRIGVQSLAAPPNTLTEIKMREIKFRAWDEHNKRFIDPITDFNIRCDNGKFQQNNSAGVIGGIIVEQYTGLKDINGTEIYEGDIVKTREDYEGDHFCKSENTTVYFDDGEFTADSNLINWVWNCEVIGNIYENPAI